MSSHPVPPPSRAGFRGRGGGGARCLRPPRAVSLGRTDSNTWPERGRGRVAPTALPVVPAPGKGQGHPWGAGRGSPGAPNKIGGVTRVRGGDLSLRPMGPCVAPARSPEGECGSLVLLPGSKTRDMEGGYSSGLCHEVPNAYSSEVLLEGRGGEPAATAEGPGTLESSRLFTKRCGDPP